MWSKLVGLEKAIIVAGVIVWILFSVYAAPLFGDADVYLFRDAASNLLHGFGFTTASFEHSQSFQRLLYSSYTPLTQWTSLPFAAVFQSGSMGETFYDLTLSAIAAVAVLWLLTERLAPGKLRLFAIALLAISLPLGYLGAGPQRPEEVTFLFLLALLLCLRTADSILRVAACGAIGGLAFLAEPIGGVLASFLIGGALLLPIVVSGFTGIRRRLALTLVAASAFLVPVAVTALCFQHQDPQSVARFLYQAKVGGYSRTESSSELVDKRTDRTGDLASVAPQQKAGKYVYALRVWKMLGALAIEIELSTVLVALAWLVLCVLSKGTLAARAALFSLGLVFYLAVFIAFPLQGNYLILTRCLFPFALLLDWGGCRKALRNERVIEAIAILNLIVPLPELALNTLTRIESRNSYIEAKNQAVFLKDYLVAHNSENGVVLLPTTQYYLYKQSTQNIFDPDYLSSQHDLRQIVAIANCDTATRFTKPGEMPLPEGLDTNQFALIAPGGEAVAVTFMGHKLMSRNWTWTCDLYGAKGVAK